MRALYALLPLTLAASPALAAPRVPGARAQLASADRALARAEQSHAEASLEAERCRRAREALMLRCLNDKLVFMGGYLRVAENERQRIQVGDWLGDRELVEGARRKLAAALAAFDALAVAARRCTWMRGLGAPGKTIVDVEIDRRIPRGDPTEPDPRARRW
jgi:hypothetical protein